MRWATGLSESGANIKITLFIDFTARKIGRTGELRLLSSCLAKNS